MKKIFFLFLIFSILIRLQVRAQSFLENFEKKTLSYTVLVPATIMWGVTSYQLLKNPAEFEGANTNFYGHHLHFYFPYLIGTILKNEFPDFYNKVPVGARTLFTLSIFIEVDDVYQHLYLQKNDDFPSKGEPAQSQVHKLYCWMLDADRKGQWKNLLTLVNLGDVLLLSAGFYQGPACELGVVPLKYKNLYLKFDQIFIAKYNPETEVEIGQIVIGASLGIKFPGRFNWLKFEAGIGKEVFLNQDRKPRLYLGFRI